MKSLGREQGFRCVRCKTVAIARQRGQMAEKRGVTIGAYEVTPSARRHLAEPLVRRRNRGYAIFPSR
ncbi:MAG: tRNA(Ile2) 2-agmatinylcytidine synthetase, partial [Halobacteriota archaeon]